MDIYLNQKLITVEHLKTLDLIAEKYIQTQSVFAIAVNDRFVPKQDYAKTWIEALDHIDVIVPMQGG